MPLPDTVFPLSITTPDIVAWVREILDHAGYNESHILQLLGVAELPTFRQRGQALLLYLWRTRTGTPLDTLVRLFFLQQSVPLSVAHQAVEPMSLDDWVEAGLVHVTHDEVMAAVELCPYQELIAAADWPRRAKTDPYQVMGIASSSRTLAQMTIRRHATRTLDLGTGCGVLAFLAAQHSDQVVAVDRNPRAVLMAQFNAQLNGLTTISCLEGDLFEPVHGQTFDLIVCNPPFVVAPGQGYLHTHSGLPADQFCQGVVKTAPAFLQEGGYCQLLCNWVQIAGQDWRERLKTWFEGTGCDTWILHSHTEDVAEYALKRIGETVEDPEQAATQFSEWMTYYEREKIEAIGFGLVAMRRSSPSANWFRCDHLPDVIGPCGEAIEKGFRARDFLEAHRDDQALLNVRLRHAENLCWEQLHEMSGKGWSLIKSHLQLGSGLAYSGNADASVVEFVTRCKADQRLGDYLRKLATTRGQKVDRLAPDFLKVVRRLVELGCLLPVEKE